VQLGQLVPLDHLELLVHLDQPETLDLLETLGPRASKVRLVSVDLQAMTEVRETQVQLGRLDHPATLEQLVSWVYEELLVRLAFLVESENLVKLELLG